MKEEAISPPNYELVVQKIHDDPLTKALSKIGFLPSDWHQSVRINLYSKVATSDHISDDEFKDLMFSAEKSKANYDALNFNLADRIFSGKEITPLMRFWLFGLLSNLAQRPGKSKHQDDISGVETRNKLIGKLVYKAVELGLSPTRNQASPPTSACDAVADALAMHGSHLSFELVAKAWGSSPKRGPKDS